ncbi:MAG: ABC transporter permease [Methanothrix sp.]|nr:ABC transporter permease [Methanothrix sp.]
MTAEDAARRAGPIGRRRPEPSVAGWHIAERRRGAGIPWAGATGLLIFTAILLMALLAEGLSPYDPWQRFEPFSAPSGEHLLGTNDMGNDILSELIYGSRVSLLVGFGAALIATIIGSAVGLLSGYYRGALDEALMGITDVILMVPQIPLIVVLSAFLRPSFWIVAMIMGALWWPSTARVVRSRALQIREMAFIESSVSLGFRHIHIILQEMLPNLWHVIAPKFLLSVASAMIAESSISFLGLGDPSVKSWGMMINFAFNRGGFINGCYWWYMPPGLCISLSVLSVSLIGFALEDREEETMRIE